jgi:hypothetical protein
MADALKTFREGEDILASETNENNQFLLSKLSDNAAQVQNYVEGEVATIKSNVASVQATLQNNIDEVANARSIYIKEFYSDGTNGYKVYNNGLCEQWGKLPSGSNRVVTFLKPFKNTNYTAVATVSAVVQADAMISVRLISFTTTTMTVRSDAVNKIGYGSNNNAPVNWMATGYVTV